MSRRSARRRATSFLSSTRERIDGTGVFVGIDTTYTPPILASVSHRVALKNAMRHKPAFVATSALPKSTWMPREADVRKAWEGVSFDSYYAKLRDDLAAQRRRADEYRATQVSK